MKVQEVISSCIMFIVSGLVLVGFTIAWFTNAEFVSVTGLTAQAVELGHVRVALTPGGPDITDLAADEVTYGEGAQYAEILMTDSLEFVPGAYGSVTFYITPVNNSKVELCEIVPMLRITSDGETWYPEAGKESVSEGGDTGENTIGDGMDDGATAPLTPEELYEIAGKHIKFFKDADMTKPLDAEEFLLLTWEEDGSIGADTEGIATDGQEQKAVIYWKWYYEYYDDYPLTEEERLIYTTEKQRIRKYDEEDMQLGNNITNMRFYIIFSAK